MVGVAAGQPNSNNFAGIITDGRNHKIQVKGNATVIIDRKNNIRAQVDESNYAEYNREFYYPPCPLFIVMGTLFKTDNGTIDQPIQLRLEESSRPYLGPLIPSFAAGDIEIPKSAIIINGSVNKHARIFRSRYSHPASWVKQSEKKKSKRSNQQTCPNRKISFTTPILQLAHGGTGQSIYLRL